MSGVHLLFIKDSAGYTFSPCAYVKTCRKVSSMLVRTRRLMQNPAAFRVRVKTFRKAPAGLRGALRQTLAGGGVGFGTGAKAGILFIMPRLARVETYAKALPSVALTNLRRVGPALRTGLLESMLFVSCSARTREVLVGNSLG
jgi:hypothetical protein